MGDFKFSLDDLESRSYRDLQQLAKSLCLPSNVKKRYLVQLIHAKKFKTAAEVDEIVKRVKIERQTLSKIRKRATRRRNHLQDTEISSTRTSQSPPIWSTPKRPTQIIVQCSPENCHSEKNLRQNLFRPSHIKKSSSPTQYRSDRVLRSFNVKKSTNFNSDKVLSVIKVQHHSRPIPAITQSYSVQPKSVLSPARCNKICKSNNADKFMQKKRRMLQPGGINQINQNASCHTLPGKSNQKGMELSPPIPTKRKRVLSGIYAIANKEPAPKRNFECMKSIGFRRSDGKLTKINAFVQKNNVNTQTNYRNIEMTVQDLINSNIDSQNINSTYIQPQPNVNPQYPNMSSITDCPPSYIPRPYNYYDMPERNYESYQGNESYGIPSVYYHKKIRGEQVRSHRSIGFQDGSNVDEQLPKINEVFSRFMDSYGSDVTQPIYVQVSNEPERHYNYPIYVPRANSNSSYMLESLYTFKSLVVLNQPLLQVATTNATKCVFSTPVMASAQTSTVVSNNGCNVSSYVQDSQYSSEPETPRMYDYLRPGEHDMASRLDCRNETFEDFSPSDSRRRSLVLGPAATIPEMVEDAMEIISQDGDYMERIEMDGRMQCMFCTWAGPRIILELHIRKEHAQALERAARREWREWRAPFSLGGLARAPLWRSRLLERGAHIYVLSGKYEDPDCFMASLSVLSSELVTITGSITVYNKVSGQPHTWSGEIQPLPPNLPYYTENDCLKLEISSLDLLPNSANLKLVNRELVVESPSKAIVGHPVLDDINVDVFVKIFD